MGKLCWLLLGSIFVLFSVDTSYADIPLRGTQDSASHKNECSFVDSTSHVVGTASFSAGRNNPTDNIASSRIPDNVADDRLSKSYGVSDWSSFWGAVLGAVISASVTIFIFGQSNCRQNKKHRKILKTSFNVIRELVDQSIECMERFMQDLEQVKKDFETFQRTGAMNNALPYREP